MPVDFQIVVRVEDYHDFDMIVEAMQTDKSVRYVDMGLGEDRRYWGLVYTGRRPKLGDIEVMIKAQGYEPIGDDNR